MHLYLYFCMARQLRAAVAKCALTIGCRKLRESSYLPFEPAMPNQCRQSDFTHYPLAGGDEVLRRWAGEMLNADA
jgi:hypothetical protein